MKNKKQNIFLGILSVFLFFSLSINAQKIIIPDSVFANNKILSLDFNKEIKTVLREITDDITKCNFYKKDSILFFVSWSKQTEANYLFIRPVMVNKMPNYISDYGFYGYTNINGLMFLFYGIQNSKFYSSLETINPLLYLKLESRDNDDYSVLCDGCSWLKTIFILNEYFIIEAEICKNYQLKCH